VPLNRIHFPLSRYPFMASSYVKLPFVSVRIDLGSSPALPFSRSQSSDEYR
jgi:hypothetical protein